jgi:hypothetical protein
MSVVAASQVAEQGTTTCPTSFLPAAARPPGNSNESTKALFKDRLKARTTPSFFFFREGAPRLSHVRCMSACVREGYLHSITFEHRHMCPTASSSGL